MGSAKLSPMMRELKQVVYELLVTLAGIVRNDELVLGKKSNPKSAVLFGDREKKKKWSTARGCERLALKQPVTVRDCPTSGSVTVSCGVRIVRTTGISAARTFK